VKQSDERAVSPAARDFKSRRAGHLQPLFSQGPADEFLTHGTRRVVYGLSLISNLREYLLGMAKRPKYYLPRRNGKATSREIAWWWVRRWVDRRIVREDVLKRISEHSLVHPIRHGGRVELPRADIEQEVLFEYW
jgi:hypothetical protein